MKYIRTKDGVYDLDKSIWYEFTGRKVKMPYCEEYEKQPGLCKTVETIEELCDEFVVVQKDFHDLLNANTHCLQTLKRYYEINKIEILGIYGAIWADKGLIYVANMNEKGELKLL